MKMIDKEFDAVVFMGQQRDKLSEKLSKMTKAEVIKYFKRRESEMTVKPVGRCKPHNQQQSCKRNCGFAV